MSRVHLVRVPTYHPQSLAGAVRAALLAVEARPRGRTIAAVSLPSADVRSEPALGAHPDVVATTLAALLRADPALRVRVSGATGSLLPARSAAKAPWPGRRGGLTKALSMLGPAVRLAPSDEARVARYQLSVGQRRRYGAGPLVRASDRVQADAALHAADSIIVFPKLGGDTLTGGLSGAIAAAARALIPPAEHRRLLGGERERVLVDLLELVDPDLVVTDAIEIGWGGARESQPAWPLGVLIASDNAVAHDAVCARILGIDPALVPHLRMAHERGYGPIDAREIAVSGDIDIDALLAAVARFSPPAPRHPAEAAARLGPPASVACRCGPDDDPDVQIATHLLQSLRDDPRFPADAPRWPPLLVLAGPEARVEGPGLPVLLGDASRAAVDAQVLTEIGPPKSWRPLFPWLPTWLRLRPPGESSRSAVFVPGAPPGPHPSAVALWLATRFRVRSPRLSWRRWWLAGPAAMWTIVLRAARNRGGLAVLHARKLERTATRTWRQRWGRPPALEARRASKPPP